MATVDCDVGDHRDVDDFDPASRGGIAPLVPVLRELTDWGLSIAVGTGISRAFSRKTS